MVTSVHVERRGAVCLVTLEGPGSRNAVGPDTALALQAAFVEFERDPEAAVAVLHGAGGHFCAGFDLKSLASGAADDWLERLHFGRPGEPALGPMGPTRLALTKPVIASITGAAVAGGMELALWCDLRVMAASAYMGVYCRRWGVPLIDGGTVRLPKVVGLGRALELILSGRRIDAGECEAIGLCNRRVADGEALDVALELGKSLAALPQACLRADRIGARQGPWRDERAALEDEFRRGMSVLAEAREGARRFARGEGRHGAPPG